MRIGHDTSKALNVEVVKVHLIQPKDEKPRLVHRLAVCVFVDLHKELLTWQGDEYMPNTNFQNPTGKMSESVRLNWLIADINDIGEL